MGWVFFSLVLQTKEMNQRKIPGEHRLQPALGFLNGLRIRAAPD